MARSPKKRMTKEEYEKENNGKPKKRNLSFSKKKIKITFGKKKK